MSVDVLVPAADPNVLPLGPVTALLLPLNSRCREPQVLWLESEAAEALLCRCGSN